MLNCFIVGSGRMAFYLKALKVLYFFKPINLKKGERMKLPVFKVAGTVAPAEKIRDFGKRIFPGEDQEIVERGTQVELRSKSGTVQVDVRNGGVWASDAQRLWKFDPIPGIKRGLLTGAEAERQSLDILGRYAVLPTITGPFRLKPARKTGSVTVMKSKDNNPRDVIQEDTTILHDVEVDVSNYDPNVKSLPVIGGGGSFGVVFGEGGKVLGTRGVWRPHVEKPKLYEVIPKLQADDMYREKMGRTPLAEFSSEMAYYSAPAFANQNLLYPVYVYSGIANFDGNKVPVRKVIIPAVDIGLRPEILPVTPPRKKTDKPNASPLPSDFQPVPGRGLPPGITFNRRTLKAKGINVDDLFVKGSANSPLILKPDLKPLLIKELGNLLGFYSAGTSWIGLSGGLAGSKNNAKGFVDGLAAMGWSIRFNWGDGNAWESDWHANDDDWVDAVDFVFYTGHANSDGWVLAKPDDTFLHFNETAGAPDMWGAKNLEWAVVAACGPLQDAIVGSGGDVLERWKNAFDGLHILMGYAQVTSDTEEEGKRLVKYAKEGATIIQSWFRTAQEIQSSGIWAGAYYVGSAAGSTGNDHLWGIGSVGPDIANPTWRACTYVPC